MENNTKTGLVGNEEKNKYALFQFKRDYETLNDKEGHRGFKK